MIWITAYKSSGEISSSYFLPSYDAILANVPKDQFWIGGNYDGDEFYIKNDLPVRLPPSPAPEFVFDYETETWVDPRSPQQVNAELWRIRAQTEIDASTLIIKLRQAGILSTADAVIAAGGDIPPSMQPILQQLPEDAQIAAIIKWKRDNVINRTHPVIVAAAYALGVTDEQLDEIFEVPTPRPVETPPEPSSEPVPPPVPFLDVLMAVAPDPVPVETQARRGASFTALSDEPIEGLDIRTIPISDPDAPPLD